MRRFMRESASLLIYFAIVFGVIFFSGIGLQGLFLDIHVTIMVSFSYIIVHMLTNNKSSTNVPLYAECEKGFPYICCSRKIEPDAFRDYGVITSSSLAEIEYNMTSGTIWLFSPDLSFEHAKNEFTAVVKDRVMNGVQYNFVAMDLHSTRGRALEIFKRNSSKKMKGSMHFYLLNDNEHEEFSLLLSLYNAAVYMPASKDEDTSGYICMGEADDESFSAYKLLSDDNISKLIGYISEIERSITPYSINIE